MGMVKRFEIWDTELNQTMGSEINKVRPCVIVSPDEANKYLNTIIVVPLTRTMKTYPTRVNCRFLGKNGQIAIDQIRSIDKSRLTRKLGELDYETSISMCTAIIETFKY